jgi:hypothetical protein
MAITGERSLKAKQRTDIYQTIGLLIYDEQYEQQHLLFQ